jgi:hypothetical protein
MYVKLLKSQSTIYLRFQSNELDYEETIVR